MPTPTCCPPNRSPLVSWLASGEGNTHTSQKEIPNANNNHHQKAPKKIKIYPPPAQPKCKDPIDFIAQTQLQKLDPSGKRRELFDYRRHARSVKPGDIIRVTFKNGDPFAGVVLSIKLRGADTSVLMRNQLTRVGVEMSVKVFSPNVESVEIVQRTQKRKRRARLYYLRCVILPFSWGRFVVWEC